MPPQRMSFGQCWVIEVVCRVARHPKPLHHPARAQVARDGERHNLRKKQLLKAKRDHRPCTFRGVAPSPKLCSQTPSNLNARSKMCLRSAEQKAR